MNKHLVIDIECKKDFFEVGGRKNFSSLGVSVAGMYDYSTNTYRAYEEEELEELETLMLERDGVIGYNISHFDFAVMQPYFKKIRLDEVYAIDLMKHLEDALGFRVRLNSVVQETLGEQKTGHGRDAVPLYKAGKIDELKKYCLDDVRLTKGIYEYGKENGNVLIRSRAGDLLTVSANWAHSEQKYEKVREILRKALDEKRMVRISYVGANKGETVVTERDIEVQAIRGAAIEAFCHLRNDRRRFMLDRIVSAEVQEKANIQPTLF